METHSVTGSFWTRTPVAIEGSQKDEIHDQVMQSMRQLVGRVLEAILDGRVYVVRIVQGVEQTDQGELIALQVAHIGLYDRMDTRVGEHVWQIPASDDLDSVETLGDQSWQREGPLWKRIH